MTELPPEALAAASIVLGHTVGCMCQRCDDVRAGVAAVFVAVRAAAAGEIARAIEDNVRKYRTEGTP